MFLSSTVLGRQIEANKKTQTKNEKTINSRKETRVEASSKKMPQVDIRVDKVKPVVP